MTNLWRSIRVTLVFAILLGVVYPFFTWFVGNRLFPYQAQGSMVKQHGTIVGSKLIAQAADKPGLFHPRPSWNGDAGDQSSGSNLGPTNPALVKEVRQNLNRAEVQTGKAASSIPPDMIESSASGLDPDISLRNAELQIPRIAKATGLSESFLQNLVVAKTKNRFLGIWGEPAVNVLELNLAVEKNQGSNGQKTVPILR